MDSSMPRHVAIIMDGNGRWAKNKNKPRHSGHRAGVKAVRKSVETAAERGIEHLTLFAFSSENWSRPEDEVSSLMNLFVEALRREVEELHRNNVKLKFVGALDELSAGLKNKISQSEDRTAANTGLSLTVAIAYGGRWDIIEASKTIAGQVADGSMQIDEIDDEAFASALQMSDTPDPDLLIRTGGEQRISNFLIWNLAYSELWFTDVLWPEFDAVVFDQALAFYAGKQRRFGHTGDQVEAVGC
jgi:undecaprenyl diphosphate synthase